MSPGGQTSNGVSAHTERADTPSPLAPSALEGAGLDTLEFVQALEAVAEYAAGGLAIAVGEVVDDTGDACVDLATTERVAQEIPPTSINGPATGDLLAALIASGTLYLEGFSGGLLRQGRQREQ